MNAFARREGRDPGDTEVAAELGVEVAEYHAMVRDAAGSRLFSLEELGMGDEERAGITPATDTPGPHATVQRQSLREQLAAAISELPERERLVLSLYYGDELNLKEIGLVLGVSESRISQIHSQAALRLRARLSGWREA